MEKGEYYGYRLDELENSMDELYAYYRMKIQQQYPKYWNVIEKIESKHVYENIQTEEKMKTVQTKGIFLLKLFQITKANSERANLSMFGLSSEAGRNKSYTIKPGTKFIDQSITGLYERYMTI